MQRAVKGILDFITQGDGKPLKDFIQQSDVTNFGFKKDTSWREGQEWIQVQYEMTVTKIVTVTLESRNV